MEGFWFPNNRTQVLLSPCLSLGINIVYTLYLMTH